MSDLNKIPRMPASRHMCLLYNPADGRIVHIHRIVNYGSAKKRPGKQAVEARCFEVAKQIGLATTGLKSLHVPDEEFKPSTPYKVDVKKRKLVAQPMPAGWKPFPAKPL
jgi:hypothetical protein